MNEEQYISFESYLNEEMSNEDKLLFEQKLQNDAQFNESFQLYKETTQLLETKFSSETTSFKDNLKLISKSNFDSDVASETKNKSKIISFKPWQYAVAASIALFIGVVFFMQNGTPNYNDYNQYEEANFTERGGIIKTLKQAQEAFNAKEYKKAIPLFEAVLKDYQRPEVEYFYGISLLEDNRILEAEVVFIKLKTGKSIYKDKATWSLALSKLKQKKYEECKKYINELPTDAEDYDKAQKLLKKL